MVETGAKLAEIARKKAELAKEIQELEKGINADKGLLDIELNKGHSTVATVERIKRNSSELERKTRELNKLK